MSIGLSHSHGRVGVTGTGPHGRELLIFRIFPFASMRISRIVSCVNSPAIQAPSQ